MNLKSLSHPGLASRLLDYLQPSSTAVLLGAAVLVGLGTSLGAILFIRLIQVVEQLSFEQLPSLLPTFGKGWVILIPTLGGLVAGPIIAFFAREAKGHGVPEVMQAIALSGGRIRPRVVIAKVAASSMCIGTGGSAGREGPIVQVGAALGSSLAQWLRFSDTRIRNLVACGAAAGIAATFNAPIAGVIFSLEVILGELAMGDLGSVVLAAVTASTVARALLGDRPAFSIPLYSVRSPLEILLYLSLGVAGALVGVLFIRSLYFFEGLFDSWRFPEALKPAVGGLLLGLFGFLYPVVLRFGVIPEDQLKLGLPVHQNIPHVYGSGFQVIEASLLGELAVGLLLALIFLKILATSFTLGSGNSGGVFAPALFMGAMTGGVFGWIAQFLFPTVITSSGPYATVGMAAVFAAAARAPLTAILIVFEMTDDYRILLPLMAAVVVSTVIAQHIQKESIYTLKLARRGIRLFRGRDMDIMSSVRVEEVMDTQPVTVSPDLPVSTLEQYFIKTNSHGFCVVDQDGRLQGIVSLQDFSRAREQNPDLDQLTIGQIATRTVITAFPDETMREVLQRMAPRDLSRLPVVSREDAHQLVGIVRRNNIVKAYEIGLMRRGFALGSLPGTPPGTAMVKLVVPAASNLSGKSLQELNLPDKFLVIHILRSRETILPHGSSTLRADDALTVLSKVEDVTELETYWHNLMSDPVSQPADKAAGPDPESTNTDRTAGEGDQGLEQGDW